MQLPINIFEARILKAVTEHQYTLISAEAGTGKSTNIPQYLAKAFTKVIVTNPRIISAITIATYVAEQMGVELGTEVGYRTGYEKNASKDTRIEYCTDGFHLIRSIFGKGDTSQKILVIDEVHEWSQQTENLVAWCKFMHDKWNTKVVMMSATMESEKLVEYLGKDTELIEIPGSTYHVEVEIRPGSAFMSSIVEEIYLGNNVLVIVPTKSEIKRIMKELEGQYAEILPLHGDLTWEEQKLCFKSYERPKVIVATPICQTSITIPDIDTVVDTGKAIVTIAKNGIIEYLIKDVSQADIKQRMKRVGRTKRGKYILCSNVGIDERREFPVPEIQRSFLSQTVLQMASIGLDAEEMEFFHQPPVEAIKEAKNKLRAIGAFNSEDKVTDLGKKIAKIPMPVEEARMIIEAEKYGVTEEVITICAILTFGSLLEKKVGSYAAFTSEEDSDLLAELDVWNKINQKQFIDFKRFGINRKRYNRIKSHINKLHSALDGIVEITSGGYRSDIIRACVAGKSLSIYKHCYKNRYIGDDEQKIVLNKQSCIDTWGDNESFVIGKPMIIGEMKILTFASVVTPEMIVELFPEDISIEENAIYFPDKDAVKVIKWEVFKGEYIRKLTYINHQHPDYAKLKAAYDEGRTRAVTNA